MELEEWYNDRAMIVEEEDKRGIGTNNRPSGEISHLNKMNTRRQLGIELLHEIKNVLTSIKENELWGRQTLY